MGWEQATGATQVSSGTIQAKTFSFVNPGPRPMPAYADKTAQVHNVIQQAITKNLAARGVSQVPSGGEVTVAYLLILGNNASTTSLNEYFGYREDLTALEDKAHKEYTQSDKMNYFEAGTLVIDVIDSKSNKLLSRGHVTKPVLQTATPDERAVRVQGVVDEVLRDVRLKP